MKKYITDEKNGLDYTLVNGVFLPNLVSTETPMKSVIGDKDTLTIQCSIIRCCITHY